MEVRVCCDPFSFASYQAREQYGGAPLLYGNTPYSKNILQEEYTPEGRPVYSRTVLKRKHPIMTQKEEGAIISDPYRMLTSEDTIFNERALRKKGDAYIVRSYAVEPVLTPELNMWFPRITSRDPSDLPCFADWTGMEKSNMTEVSVSETLDSAGNYTTRLNAAGERARKKEITVSAFVVFTQGGWKCVFGSQHRVVDGQDSGYEIAVFDFSGGVLVVLTSEKIP